MLGWCRIEITARDSKFPHVCLRIHILNLLVCFFDAVGVVVLALGQVLKLLEAVLGIAEGVFDHVILRGRVQLTEGILVHLLWCLLV